MTISARNQENDSSQRLSSKLEMIVLAFQFLLPNRYLNNLLTYGNEKYGINGDLAPLAASCNSFISCSETAMERSDAGRQRKQLEMRLTCIYS